MGEADRAHAGDVAFVESRRADRVPMLDLRGFRPRHMGVVAEEGVEPRRRANLVVEGVERRRHFAFDDRFEARIPSQLAASSAMNS